MIKNTELEPYHGQTALTIKVNGGMVLCMGKDKKKMKMTP